MVGYLKFLRSSSVRCYFITGTGRCGTMLLSKLLSLGHNTYCDHERSVLYSKIKPAYLTGDMEPLYKEIGTVIEPLVKSHNRKGLSYGESSGLLYLAFEEIYRRYGGRVRFILLTRRPDEFVRSALARGFFVPEHPYALEHLRARFTTEMGQRWETKDPFEKCLWYWNLVNGMVSDFFFMLPHDLWMIQPIEELDYSACRELYRFLQIEGFNEQAVDQLLSMRVNATPGRGDGRHDNPKSVEVTLGDRSTWDRAQLSAYKRWAEPLSEILYPKECSLFDDCSKPRNSPSPDIS